MGVHFLGAITRIPMLATVMLLNLFNVICKSFRLVSNWFINSSINLCLRSEGSREVRH